ncbi:tripartite tricarboxylate transporter substrate binding protein [Reyranella sp.]|uniref:Bug family tripartite tricarboxylate transporter substrate binding protein n=1 Tax=Reyranella sp. TaxID=1929291 RepID=UPI002730E25B|nr:tripartite tricarboxylate transporter substrate binding protein [Reyranella sp.]MDP2374983.1 tripartite tricarboxylate transporter substrate binding protein [Reyranella sp.]
MRRRAFTSSALATLAAPMAASLAAPAIAQTWPAKQLHMVIPYPPGGPSDVSTRIVMDRAAQILGQSVLFDNKAGASGMIGAEYVKNQPVDTYTFLTTTTAMVCITRHLQPIPFDPEKDFIPVSRMSTSWGAFAVHPSVPAKTVAEFVAYAKANPGKINYGSAGLATITHLFGEMLNLEAGIQMVHVPYRGSAPATNALLAGEVQVQFDQLTLPHIKAGKVRGLAMLAEVRHPDFPDIPTLREQGYGKDGGDSWFGVLAPAGTPLAVVAKLDQAIAAALRAPDIMAKVHNGGMRVTYLNPADFKERIAVENKSFGEIIKKGNIKLT